MVHRLRNVMGTRKLMFRYRFSIWRAAESALARQDLRIGGTGRALMTRLPISRLRDA